MFAVQQLGLTVAAEISGQITNAYGFGSNQWFFIILQAAGGALCFFIMARLGKNFADVKKKYVFDSNKEEQGNEEEKLELNA